MKSFVILILFGLISANLCAQTADYTQNLNFSLSTNPAFAGANQNPRLFAGYRTKYMSLSNPFINYCFSADAEVKGINAGVGLQLYREEAGETAFKTHFASVVFSKTLKLSTKTILKLATDVGFKSYGLDVGGITTQDMAEAGYGFIYPNAEELENNSSTYLNLGAGVLIYNEKVAGGVALKNLNEPGRFSDDEFKRQLFPLLMNIHFNLMFKKGNVDICPALLIKKQRQSDLESVGIVLRPRPMIAGLALNSSFKHGTESFSFIIGFMQKKYKFAYNCDLSLNSATKDIFDTHEISITFTPGKGKEKPSAINCPAL